jgi:hypothetical protein
MTARIKSTFRFAEVRRRRQAAASALRELDERILRRIGLHREDDDARMLALGIDPRF